MTPFHDVLFPVALSLGVTGGPERRIEIVSLSSGHEQRNARSALSRRRYDVGTAMRSIDDLYAVMAFFGARRGSLHAFRLRDPFDMKSGAPTGMPTAHDQELGVGDGVRAQFALFKRYGSGDDAHERPISRARIESVRVAVAGIEQQAGVAFSATAGGVTFLAGHLPGPEQIVTAGFEFDTPVRFDTDRLELNLAAFRAGQIPTIPLLEVIE